jgi:hypothetical protein
LTRLAYCFCFLGIFHLEVSREWKLDRIGSSIKFGNGMEGVEGVDGDDSESIDRKNDRK